MKRNRWTVLFVGPLLVMMYTIASEMAGAEVPEAPVTGDGVISAGDTPPEPEPPLDVEPRISTEAAQDGAEPAELVEPGDEAAAPAFKDPLIRIAARGGLGLLSEDGADAVATGLGEVAVQVAPVDGLRLDVHHHFRTASPTYLARGAVVQGLATFEAVTAPEHWLETGFDVSWNVLSTVTADVALRVMASARLVQTLSDGFDRWLLAAGGGAELTFRLSDRVAAELGYTFATRATGAARTPSTGGLVRHLHAFAAGFLVELDDAGTFALELRYDGRAIMFELVERFHHSVLGGLRASF